MSRRAFLKTAIAAAVSGTLIDELAIYIPVVPENRTPKYFSFEITEEFLKDIDDEWFYCQGGMCRCGHYHEPGWKRNPVFSWQDAVAKELAARVDEQILQDLQELAT